jgi:hypothetical protein
MKALLGILAAVGLAACGSAQRQCTLIACAHLGTAHFDGTVGAHADPLAVTVCRNGVCAPDGAFPDGTTTARCALTGTAFHCDVFAGDFADGDVFAFRVRDAGGATLLDVTRTATYQRDLPNGPGCGPVCGVATLTP